MLPSGTPRVTGLVSCEAIRDITCWCLFVKWASAPIIYTYVNSIMKHLREKKNCALVSDALENSGKMVMKSFGHYCHIDEGCK